MTSTSGQSSTSAERVAADTLRAEWGRLLSLLAARTRRLDLAEDALSEAFTRASDHWRAGGVHGNPAGWLYTTAWRIIVGRLRAEAVAGRHVPLLAIGRDWVPPANPAEFHTLDDDRYNSSCSAATLRSTPVAFARCSAKRQDHPTLAQREACTHQRAIARTVHEAELGEVHDHASSATLEAYGMDRVTGRQVELASQTHNHSPQTS
jgi:DNA-directed RNA polymerase specialized sigma24 family protein